MITNRGKDNNHETLNNLNIRRYITLERTTRLVNTVEQMLNTEENPLKKSIFKFENTVEAAEHNAKIISACDFDYEKAISKQKGTTIYYGSKFRPTMSLQKLLYIFLLTFYTWIMYRTT